MVQLVNTCLQLRHTGGFYFPGGGGLKIEVACRMVPKRARMAKVSPSALSQEQRFRLRWGPRQALGQELRMSANIGLRLDDTRFAQTLHVAAECLLKRTFRSCTDRVCAEARPWSCAAAAEKIAPYSKGI